MVKIEYKCPVCNHPAAAYMTPCFNCNNMMFHNQFETCSLCAADLAGSDNPCLTCRNSTIPVDGLKALGGWHGPLREWLSELKYGGDIRLADWLSEQLFKLWFNGWKGIPIVPVPPRTGRLFHNGLDPVGLIAKGLETRGVPVNKLLRRIGNQTQKSLSRSERLNESSLKYVIKVHSRIDMKEYVLLDDVSTTGATLNVCARTLKSAGAERVYGVVVCKD